MRYYGAISAAVLFVWISLLPSYSPLMQAFAQPNGSVKILITDAIEDLQNNDTNTALTHSNLASQELSSQGVSSSDSALVLIDDAIRDLLNNDTDTALTHLSLVSKQLEIPSNTATTSAVSLNKTSALNTTIIETQEENATIMVSQNECTDNNLNGRCSLDNPKSSAHVCFDANHDLYCDWFRPIINQTVENTLMETQNAVNFIDYENPIYGFKIQYPSNWEEREFNREYTNLIVQFRGPDTTISDNITNPVRFDITLLDDQYGGKQYTDINEAFSDRLQMYVGGGDILNSFVSVINGNLYYTISTDVGSSIITEYVIMANNLAYLLSWEVSDSLAYNQFLPIAQKMVDSFKITNSQDIAVSPPITENQAALVQNDTDNPPASEQQPASASTTSVNTTKMPETPVAAPPEGYYYCDDKKGNPIYLLPGHPETPNYLSENCGIVGVDIDVGEEYCEDFDGDGFCDITHSSDGSTIVEDQGAIERLKEGNDGAPDTQQRQPSGSISIPIQPQQNRINWGAICRNPIVDSFISEPCGTLTSPDGFTLTPEGERVLRCIGGGAVVTLLAPEVLASIRSLGPAVGCGASPGGQASGSNPSAPDNNPLGTILGGLLTK